MPTIEFTVLGERMLPLVSVPNVAAAKASVPPAPLPLD